MFYQTLQEIPDLPHDYQMTGAGERLLLFDSGIGDTNRMFIFPTNDTIDMLGNCSLWFVDGTFTFSPQIFSQVSTVHGLVNDKVLPYVFALLSSKAETVFE